MTETAMNRRHVCLALLGTLIVWILAQGAGGWAAVSAAPVNQTIPTMTPTGLPVTPPPAVPTQPPPSEPSTVTPPAATPTAVAGSLTPTALLGTSTPLPAGTASPSATAAATGDVATTAMATLTATGEPASSEEAAATNRPASPTPTQAGVHSTGTQTPLPVAGAEPRASRAPGPESPPASDGSGQLLSSPCLWVSAGLALIALGVALLVGLRRAT